MNGNRALLDSNVIIDASQGLISIESITSKYNYIYVSVISYVETLGFHFISLEEESIVKQILNNVEIINLNKAIADKAIEFRKIKKIKLPDAFVLSTASTLKADLVTSDIKEFQNIDKSINLVIPKSIELENE